jgi:hypothetical protein
MSVSAYITVGGQTVIPVLLPDVAMIDTARQIGIPQEDLFRVDVPVGMTQHTRASVLIASTQLSSLYSATTVTLTLQDSSGLTVTLSGMYARPPQPFFWGQQGGVVMVELVDHRWYWQFSSAAVLNETLSALWSSDGRWQVNGSGASFPITTYAQLITQIETAASGDNLNFPTGFITRSPEYIRRLSDFVGSPNVSLALLYDAIAVANRQIIVSTGAATIFIERDTLKTQYDSRMNTYKTALRGGMQPVNGAAGGTDALVNLWNQNGFQARAPRSCSIIMPSRSVEGLTVYDNCTSGNTPATQQQFTEKSIYAAGSVPTWTRQPNDIGGGYMTESAVIVKDNAGATLTTSPGWNPTGFNLTVRAEYASRYSNTPFGRTVWAGWLPWYTSTTNTLGQIGNVSYRLAVIDGEWSPYTISECREEDWRFGLQGTSANEPVNVVTGKGLAQAYKNCVGATIIDVAPPNTRVFPAKITASEQMQGWIWLYSWTEVEPNPALGSSTPQVSIGAYARSGSFSARNMSENGNVYVGAGNAGNIIAPGVRQSDYAGADIEALPISVNTVVMMCEQFPTSNTAGSPPFGPQYWFSMPNAVLVTCTQGGQLVGDVDGGTFEGAA